MQGVPRAVGAGDAAVVGLHPQLKGRWVLLAGLSPQTVGRVIFIQGVAAARCWGLGGQVMIQGVMQE